MGYYATDNAIHHVSTLVIFTFEFRFIIQWVICPAALDESCHRNSDLMPHGGLYHHLIFMTWFRCEFDSLLNHFNFSYVAAIENKCDLTLTFAFDFD